MFEMYSLKLKEDCKIVFTGDIVDRGPFGLQILALVTCLVLANWTPSGGNVILCNGNHEDCDVFTEYGLDKELRLHSHNVMCENGVLAPSSLTKFLDYIPTCCVMRTGAGLVLLARCVSVWKRKLQPSHHRFAQ